MANIITKKLNYASRLTDANQQLLNLADTLIALKAEWDANAYASGASPAENNIVDGDLTGSLLAYLTANQLDSLIGAHVSVCAAVTANRGYLEAARP